MRDSVFKAKHFRQNTKLTVGRTAGPLGYVFVALELPFDPDRVGPSILVQHFTPDQARKVSKILRKHAETADEEAEA